MSKFYSQEEQKNPYPDLDNKSNAHKANPYQTDKQHGQDIFSKHDHNQNLSSRPGDLRQSVFLKTAVEEKKDEPGCCGSCCACCSLDYYKDYFQVTNKVVTHRMALDLKFWQGGFFNDLKEDYDFYGPVWIYTTMVFVCSAVHNVLLYQLNPKNFKYNFQVIGVAFGIFYILGFLLSVVYGLLFGCIGLACKVNHIVCLYGYSMTIYVICGLLCIINMELTTWLFLLYAAGTKVAFILKNIFQKLQVPGSKKVVLLVLVIAQAGIQLLAIKYALLNPYTKYTISNVTSASHFQGVMLRSHESM